MAVAVDRDMALRAAALMSLAFALRRELAPVAERRDPQVLGLLERIEESARKLARKLCPDARYWEELSRLAKRMDARLYVAGYEDGEVIVPARLAKAAAPWLALASTPHIKRVPRPTENERRVLTELVRYLDPDLEREVTAGGGA